ncbi:hypothetical protein Sru01_53130 [Sphaerisporangium rufum]|uniref:Uncharacterized protein n=1 Tax=Sphaerisporangium rufum TaxID=1381558 RepID=A0A919R605_9ACTN|nr:hypothetical protein Sru01_53130 [Sphaerisporangium rufum]
MIGWIQAKSSTMVQVNWFIGRPPHGGGAGHRPPGPPGEMSVLPEPMLRICLRPGDRAAGSGYRESCTAPYWRIPGNPITTPRRPGATRAGSPNHRVTE